MAGEIIRPSALPDRPNPVASEKVPVDNGVTVGGATVEKLVLAGRPTASQPEAEAGTDPLKAMTPLTTKQAVDAQVPSKINAAITALNLGSAAQAETTDFATSAQGAKADTAVQPGDLAAVATTGDYNDLINKPSGVVPGDETVTNAKLVAFNPAVSANANKLAYTPAASGSIPASMDAKLKERLSYFDFVPATLRDGIAAGTDITTDQASYWQAFRDALQAVATAGGKPHGVIPSCTIYSSVAPNFAIPGLHLETQGVPKIISTSTAPGFRCDATGLGSGGWGLFGLKIGSLMAGGASCARGIDIRYCHQSEFDPLFCLGATSIGIYLSFLVSSLLRNPTCSVSPIGGTYLAVPGYGIWIGAEAGDPLGTASGWTTLINPIGEHVANGIVIDRANGTLFLGGVAESCSTIGLTITPNALYTNLVGTDFEANTSWDIYNSGLHGTFHGIKSQGRVTFTDNAALNLISGGVFHNIDFDTSTRRNVVRDILFASQSGGGITDNGAGNRFINAWNHQTEKYYSEWKAASLVAAPSSGGGATFSANGRFFVDGRTVHFTANVSVTAAGTGAGYLSLVLPYAAAAGRDYCFAGIEIGHSGKGLSCYLAAGTTNLQIREAADASYPAGENGDLIVVSGSYERA